MRRRPTHKDNEHRWMVEVWFPPHYIDGMNKPCFIPEDEGSPPDEVHYLEDRADVDNLLSELRIPKRLWFYRAWINTE